jgi:hypothetical protein
VARSASLVKAGSSPQTRAPFELVRQYVAFLDRDRYMDEDMATTGDLVRSGTLSAHVRMWPESARSGWIDNGSAEDKNPAPESANWACLLMGAGSEPGGGLWYGV